MHDIRSAVVSLWGQRLRSFSSNRHLCDRVSWCTAAMASSAPLSTTTTMDPLSAKKVKLTGRAFYESIGSPRMVLAPMVDQSEFAWRLLTRSFMDPEDSGKILAYTPMFHARIFNQSQQFRDKHFQPTRANATIPAEHDVARSADEPYLDGRTDIDRPLTVQFCANDPDELLQAAQQVQPYCDAVDLNLGCPQRIAKNGHYGAFLQEDQDLIYRLINRLHVGLDVPVTAKIRVLETKEATLDYAKRVLSAGASILTVHGRRREQKGHNTGLADWSMIRYLRDNLPRDTVLFANGNILRHGDIARCLEATGADGVMSAEGNLHDPTIFAPPPKEDNWTTSYWRSPSTGRGGYRMDYVFRRYLSIIYQYVLERPEPPREPLFDPSNPTPREPIIQNPYAEEVEGPPKKKQKKRKKTLKTSPSLSAMQPHLFHLLRPLVAANTNVRDALARAGRGADMTAYEYVLALAEQAVRRGLIDYTEDPSKYEDTAIPEGNEDVGVQDITDYESSLRAVHACKMPWWVCQPYVRPLPSEAIEKGSMQLSKKQRETQAEEVSKIENSAAATEKESLLESPKATTNQSRKRGFESISQGRADEEPQPPSEVPTAAEVCG